MSGTRSPLAASNRVELDGLAAALQDQFRASVSLSRGEGGIALSIALHDTNSLPFLCKFLFWDAGCPFGGLTVEEHLGNWRLSYLFLAPGSGWIEAIVQQTPETPSIPSISSSVHAADWHEREAEDLFGLIFEGHPRLGDFILHDQIWPEGVAPHRKSVDVHQTHLLRRPNPDWRPLLVVQDPGSFAMPVGPVYEGGVGEPVHFLLETVGEDVVRAVPRLFYKFRGVEKIAEGKRVSDVLLLAERFAATSSFAHSLAFSLAIERVCDLEIPARAKHLRILLAELERLRHHAGAITGICESTALAVAASQAAIIEEQLLRTSCHFTGHRYLLGINTPGGLRRDFTNEEFGDLVTGVDRAVDDLRILENRLDFTSSFLDRLEDVGVVDPDKARDLNLVGPVGRASGSGHDLRQECPYGGYDEYEFAIPRETEGDGFARLRVLFEEAYESGRLIHQAIQRVQPGPVVAHCEVPRSG
ncbi:MAG: NADH-quinone oxidoreductase subunit C, partial [Candidatus Acidiferrales bacterium]